MIDFIKRHKWWFIGGGLALVVYWLYKRAQSNAAAAPVSTSVVPQYPSLIYGGGGSVSGVTGSTGSPAAPAVVTNPSPATPDATQNPVTTSPSPGGITGGIPDHPSGSIAPPPPGTVGSLVSGGGGGPMTGYDSSTGQTFTYDPNKPAPNCVGALGCLGTQGLIGTPGGTMPYLLPGQPGFNPAAPGAGCIPDYVNGGCKTSSSGATPVGAMPVNGGGSSPAQPLSELDFYRRMSG